MKKSFTILLWAIAVAVGLSGCADPCADVTCANGGNCYEGECNCPPAWTGETCTVDKCDDLNCQNGDCENGECDCDPGYHGVVCEFKTATQYTGSWTAVQNCVRTGATNTNSNYSVSIAEGSSILVLTISQIGGFGGPVTATVVDENHIDIPQQSRNGNLLSGGGTLNGSGSLNLNFTYGNATTTYDCSATLTR